MALANPPAVGQAATNIILLGTHNSLTNRPREERLGGEGSDARVQTPRFGEEQAPIRSTVTTRRPSGANA